MMFGPEKGISQRGHTQNPFHFHTGPLFDQKDELFSAHLIINATRFMGHFLIFATSIYHLHAQKVFRHCVWRSTPFSNSSPTSTGHCGKLLVMNSSSGRALSD